MKARAWVVAAVAVALAVTGFAGYQLGLRAGKPGAPTGFTTSQPSTPGASSTANSRPGQASFAPYQITPSPTLGPGSAGLNCKLPVYSIGGDGSGGFITFPGGAFSPDSSSEVTTKVGSDFYGLTYDRKVGKWLPVPPTWVAPDGSLYAYALDLAAHAANQVFVVNAETGSGVSLGGVGTGWQVIGVSQTTIYAEPFHGTGVWTVAISGTFNPQLLGDGYPEAASGFYVFASSIPDGGAIARMDVRSPATRVPWFNKSASAEVIGFDGSGNAVISTGSELWIATAADQATRISTVPLLAPPSQLRPDIDGPVRGTRAPVADSHGLWFSTTDGIYLYDGTASKQVISSQLQVAGPCV